MNDEVPVALIITFFVVGSRLHRQQRAGVFIGPPVGSVIPDGAKHCGAVVVLMTRDSDDAPTFDWRELLSFGGAGVMAARDALRLEKHGLRNWVEPRETMKTLRDAGWLVEFLTPEAMGKS